jgi:hypothetical protein
VVHVDDGGTFVMIPTAETLPNGCSVCGEEVPDNDGVEVRWVDVGRECRSLLCRRCASLGGYLPGDGAGS